MYANVWNNMSINKYFDFHKYINTSYLKYCNITTIKCFALQRLVIIAKTDRLQFRPKSYIY